MLSDRPMVHIRTNFIKFNLTVNSQVPKLYRIVTFGARDCSILASVTVAQFSI